MLLRGGEDDDHDDHEAAEHDHDAEHHHHHGEFNMHLWMSPEIAQKTAVAIHEKLLELMPQDKVKLDANLQHFEAELADTDKRIISQLAPVKDKGYFVFHDAYTYFEKHYGLSPTGHFTVNPEIQPGAQRLHQIRTQLVEKRPFASLLSHNSGRRSSMLLPVERRCVKARSIHWAQTSA